MLRWMGILGWTAMVGVGAWAAEPLVPQAVIVVWTSTPASQKNVESLEDGMVLKIVSGGQTGVDRAALDVALENDLGCGGWCPKGRRAEDGIIDEKYPLIETASPSPTQRTEGNVRDSDGTLILSWGTLAGGTLQTAAVASRLKKPVMILNMKENPQVDTVEAWVEKLHIRVLNIAGPRESEYPGAYAEAKAFLKLLLVGTD